MNREINVQVYNDGGRVKLDPHYHLAAINIFCKALNIADLNGFRNEFPQEYLDTIEKMIVFYANVSFPDYTNPSFSDAKLTNKKKCWKNSATGAEFPKNQFIKYLATDGKEGALPEYLSKGFLKSGFFVFRNSWGTDATQMVVKAGPKAFWHCQPDNGTFELWFNGKNLFPDSGSYVYAGEGRSDGTTQLAPSDLRTQHRNAEQQESGPDRIRNQAVAAGRQRTDIGYRESELQEPETPPFRILRRQQLLRNCRRNGGKPERFH